MASIKDILASLPGAGEPMIYHTKFTVQLRASMPTIAIHDSNEPEHVSITTLIGKSRYFPQALAARDALTRAFPQEFTVGTTSYPYIPVNAKTGIDSGDIKRDPGIINLVVDTHLAIAFLSEPFFDPAVRHPDPDDLAKKLERRIQIMRAVIS